ncbi:MAG: hypothetical protein P8N76_17105 [Pirellulaceae bacterium]|nr:hypothetical protein [Pirellulaceae bacterium]
MTTLVQFHQRQRRRIDERSLDAKTVYGATVGDDDKLQTLATLTTVVRLLLKLD